jgi:hypothetical protein
MNLLSTLCKKVKKKVSSAVKEFIEIQMPMSMSG